MSFGASANPYGNKESEIFGQSINDPCNDFFHFFQYLDFDAVEVPEGSSSLGDKSELTHVVSTIGDSNSAGTAPSPMDVEARKIDLLLQPWLGESTEKQSTKSFYEEISSDVSFYSEQSGRAAISDSELLSLERIMLSSPKLPSLPSSPSQLASKSARRRDRILSSVSRTFKRGSRASQDTLRPTGQRPEDSPKMMSSSRYSPDWEQRMVLDAHKFDYEFPQHGLPISRMPMSPPPSAGVSEALSNSTAIVFKTEGQGNDFYAAHQFLNGVNNYTPLTTPTDGHVEMRNIQTSNDNQYASTPLQSPWESSSNNGGFGDYRGSTAFMADNEVSPLWWNHATTTEVVHPAPTVYHNDSRNANKSLAMQLQNDLTYNPDNVSNTSSNMPTGLMIQMPESDNQQSYIIEASPRTQQGFFGSPLLDQSKNNPYNGNNHQRSSRRRRHQNRSPSPLPNPSPKSHSHAHSRSSSHSQTQKSPGRGKRDTRAESTGNANYHTSKRSSRTPSRKSSSNNISAQRSQSLQSPVVDFVNFTPSDSMRLLTGVAPSGSSKTKARREKEANEKRRRLSMAAMRAVRAAGGDVESLVEEGLFV